MSGKQIVCVAYGIAIIALAIALGCSDTDFFDPSPEGSLSVIIELRDGARVGEYRDKSHGCSTSNADIMAIDRVRVVVSANDITTIVKECDVNGNKATCSIKVAAGENRNICVEVYESDNILYCGRKTVRIEGGRTNSVTVACFERRDSLRNDDDYPTGFFSDIDGKLCYFASRFTPQLPCTLKKLYTEFYTPTDSQFVAQTCSLFVWDNAGDNTPGQIVFEDYWDIQDTIYPDEIWIYSIDIYSQAITFDSDFWVGIKMNDLHAPYLIADGTDAPPKRNALKCPGDNVWYSYTSGDFLIYSSVLYQCCGGALSSGRCSEGRSDVMYKEMRTSDRARMLKSASQ